MRLKARLALAVLLAGNLLSAAWADDAKFSAPRDFTLALGDSLAFGYQAHKVAANPLDLAQFHTGFAFVFAQRVAATSAGKSASLLNLGCPGETTTSFLNGPCAYHAAGLPLHLNYTGSQMAFAEALLAANRGRINPILVSLGANDVLTLIGVCPGLTPTCVAGQLPGILQTVGANLDQVLARLRGAARDAEIIVLQVYNPLEVAFPGSNSNVLAIALNQVIGSVATAHGARVANAFPAFNQAAPQPQVLCVMTLMCGLGGIPPADIHASDLGYATIADLMFRAAGYTRFEQ
jgi:lysophospholipase L1-like esterase